MKRTESKLFLTFLLIYTFFLCSNCYSKNAKVEIKSYKESYLYNKAITEFQKNDLKNAIKSFEKVNEIYYTKSLSDVDHIKDLTKFADVLNRKLEFCPF